MCGRYKVKKQFLDGLGADELQETRIKPKIFVTRYNIGPGQRAPVMFRDAGGTVIDEMLWRQPPLYLARAETVATLPTFSTPFKSRRCLVLMNGFYEWDERVKPRQPWHFQYQDDGSMYVGGIWWVDAGEPAFTLITKEADETVAQAHHRMPAIIPANSRKTWLAEDTAEPALKALIKPMKTPHLAGWPVSLKVNNWRNQGEELVERFDPPKRPIQGELF